MDIGLRTQSDDSPVIVKFACFATLSNLNLISLRALARNKHLFREDGEVCKIKPFIRQFAGGRATSRSHVAVETALVRMRDSSYPINYIIGLDNLTTDYTLDFPFV